MRLRLRRSRADVDVRILEDDLRRNRTRGFDKPCEMHVVDKMKKPVANQNVANFGLRDGVRHCRTRPFA